MNTTNGPIISLIVAPARERGLKCTGKYNREGSASRRSREGAWIEIVSYRDLHGQSLVAPARERGLKSSYPHFLLDVKLSLPRGSVD